MKRRTPIKFTLDNFVHFGKKAVMIRDVVRDLSEQFPDGFGTKEGSRYLITKYGHTPAEFTYGNSASIFYKALERANFIELDIQRSTKSSKFWKVKAQVGAASNEQRVPFEFEAERGLYLLTEAHATIFGGDPGTLAIGALEKAITTDSAFLTAMGAIKEKSPPEYAKKGGLWLDRLVEKYAIK